MGGGVKELRIDHLTGSTDYQGLYLKNDGDAVYELDAPPHGAVIAKHINLVGLPTARYQFWFQPEPGYGDIVLEDVWIQVPSERRGRLLKSVFPEPDIREFPRHQAQLRQNRDGIPYVEWSSTTEPKVIGRINSGSPPNGDFVPPGVAGIGYVSPGYLPNLLKRQFRRTPLLRKMLLEEPAQHLFE